MPANYDLGQASYLIKVLGRSSPLLILLPITGLPFYPALLSWLLFALLVSLSCGRLGSSFANLLHGTGQQNCRPSAACAAALDKARFHKRAGRPAEALRLINTTLDQYPQQPAALLLKAEVLWLGFANRAGALACLERLLSAPSVEECYLHWGRALRHEIAAATESLPPAGA